MAVYDCMTFWMENDLLEIRINQHWDKVDKFIIVEAGETHTGKKKPYNFDHERFKPYMDKIIYRTFDSFDQAMKDHPELTEAYWFDRGPDKNSMDWARDHFQCSYIRHVLDEVGAADDDIVYICCTDELLRSSSFDSVKQLLTTNVDVNNPPVVMFKHWLYAYKFNLVHKTPQEADTTSMATLCSTYRKTLPATLRDQRTCTHVINDAGWHFCFMDGKDGEDILAKQQAWAHSRDVEEGKTLKYDNQTPHDALVRLFDDYSVKKVPLDTYHQPQYIIDNQDKFENYIFHDDL
jgi:beta-1,4-mannosyl-glycoprotein beta-1,4-N-acetylglucosaminyltransferase